MLCCDKCMIFRGIYRKNPGKTFTFEVPYHTFAHYLCNSVSNVNNVTHILCLYSCDEHVNVSVRYKKIKKAATSKHKASMDVTKMCCYSGGL